MWPPVFQLTNTVALGAWLLLLLAPRRIVPALRYAVVGFLCAVYVLLVGGVAAGWFDPGRDDPAPLLATFDVSTLRALFASDGGVVIGWTHYLAVDLFIGCWVADDMGRRGVGRAAQAPVLLLVFLAAPLGLLAWFLMKRRRGAT